MKINAGFDLQRHTTTGAQMLKGPKGSPIAVPRQKADIGYSQRIMFCNDEWMILTTRNSNAFWMTSSGCDITLKNIICSETTLSH